MVGSTKLDAPRSARASKLIVCAIAVLAGAATRAQEAFPDSSRLVAVQKAFENGNWEQAAKLAAGPTTQPAELDFLAGLAQAKLQHWEESRVAFEAGYRKAPGDARFLVELAGVRYKQKDFGAAKRDLRKALRQGSRDSYTLEFLGSIYFQEGNLEAALKYWNRIEKPRLRTVSIQPTPRVNEALMSRAVEFNAPQILMERAVMGTDARLQNLGTFAQTRLDLAPTGTGSYDATLHVVERNGWGDSKLAGAISLLSGVPYATVYPEFYTLGHRAVNVKSLVRWDAEKRRAFVDVSSPLFGDPAKRLDIYADARNENWNLTNTFFGAGLALNDIKLKRAAGGARFRRVASGWWSWTAGIEAANRSFGNLPVSLSTAEKPFFTNSNSVALWLGVDGTILRVPERRLTVEASGEARGGRSFADGLGAFEMFRGSVQAEWFPRTKGDDYELRAQLNLGDTLGGVPMDELFQLGVERDNDLWLRGHAGTFQGRKGAAPLGRRYFLTNWDFNKKVYSNGLFSVRLGPFLDNGAIADTSGLLGSRGWLWDIGAQCKIRVFGGPEIVLSYGRDLRGNHNGFYGTTLH